MYLGNITVPVYSVIRQGFPQKKKRGSRSVVYDCSRACFSVRENQSYSTINDLDIIGESFCLSVGE